MNELTKENAIIILDWYEKEGKENWGLWTNLPEVPISASFNSFDTCHLRILFDEEIFFNDDGEPYKFNCIADSKRAPSKKVKNIMTISMLKYLTGYNNDKS